MAHKVSRICHILEEEAFRTQNQAGESSNKKAILFIPTKLGY
jgi:hypothetical protein